MKKMCLYVALAAAVAWVGRATAQPAVFDQPIQPAKASVPSDEARQAARKQINAIFADPIPTSADKEKRAKVLLQTARQANVQGAEQFEVLNLAREVAAVGGKIRLAYQAIDQLDAAFEFDAHAIRLATLASAANARLAPDDKREVVVAGVEMIEELIDRDDYDRALSVADEMRPLAVRVADVELRKALVERRDRASQLRRAYRKVEPAFRKLAQNANDPDANLAVGKWQLFQKANWNKALPLLAKGSDDALAAAARAELKVPSNHEEEGALANMWWELAKEEKDVATRDVLLGRALAWYRRAGPGLKGLAAAQARARERELRNAGISPSELSADLGVFGRRPPQPLLPALAIPQEEPEQEPVPQPEPEAPPKSPVATFAAPDQIDRVSPINTGDGKYTLQEISSYSFLVANGNYLYFKVADGYLNDLPLGTPVAVRVTLLDNKQQNVDIEYDGHSTDPTGKSKGVWTGTKRHQLRGTRRIKQINFLLPRAKLANRQNYGADFRIRGAKLAVCRVEVAVAR